nr:MAG TPA: hypothetical protein [Caudoviricetes sp.]
MLFPFESTPFNIENIDSIRIILISLIIYRIYIDIMRRYE